MLFLPEHDPCFAHSIQLVVKDGFKDARGINKVLSKAASIVSYVRKSIRATEILEGEKRLQARVVTRWNSELKSIRSLLSIPSEKLQQLDCQQLTTYERGTLEDLVDILTPFEEATDFTQGQNVVTASFIIPCIKGLRASLNSLILKYPSMMVSNLKSSLDRRMSPFEEREHFQYAAILDPRCKLGWCAGVEQSDIKNRFEKMVQANSHTVSNLTTSSTVELPPSPKRSKLFSYMSQGTAVATSTTQNESEVESYFSQPTLPENADPLDYWKQSSFPILSKLAQHYLSIPASSAPVERLFSIAGKIYRPDRCSLSDSVFQKLITIKCNGHILS